MKQHSQTALENEFLLHNGEETSRRYAVGYYSCPYQAGNRIHNFINSLIWAIVTNRTLLWKYYDTSTCQRVGKGFDRAICLNANNEEDCAKILHRASWFPSYDEWSEKLNITEIQKIDSNHIGKQSSLHDRNSTMKLADRLGRFQTIEFPQMLGQNAKVLQNPDIRNNLQSEKAKRQALALFDSGVDYLYGFLFHKIFGFQPPVRSSIPLRWEKNTLVNNKTIYNWQKWIANTAINTNPSTRTLTVVLHSRHPKESDEGTNIGWEKECIQKILRETILDNNTNHDEMNEPLSDYDCTVVLLSDRQKTIDKLAKYLKRHHCTAVVASHGDISSSWRDEHGPYAGIGFYQDLWLVHNQIALTTEKQQIAFIGHNHRRTSSTLIQEVLVHSYHNSRNTNRTRAVDDILTCFQEDIRK